MLEKSLGMRLWIGTSCSQQPPLKSSFPSGMSGQKTFHLRHYALSVTEIPPPLKKQKLMKKKPKKGQK